MVICSGSQYYFASVKKWMNDVVICIAICAHCVMQSTFCNHFNLFPKVESFLLVMGYPFRQTGKLYWILWFKECYGLAIVQVFSLSHCGFLCFRGKCLVTLYNEAEVLPKYLEKEVCFCVINFSPSSYNNFLDHWSLDNNNKIQS